jgi:hypothetical protein
MNDKESLFDEEVSEQLGLCVKEKDVANKKTLDKEAGLEVCFKELRLEFWKR